MLVRVRLFAILRERAGTSELELDLPEGARVRDAIAQVTGMVPGLPLVMAVNREYADEDTLSSAGDELALIPPVSRRRDDGLRAARRGHRASRCRSTRSSRASAIRARAR